jgi:transcriptional regulator with XRE-family HTH domain
MATISYELAAVLGDNIRRQRRRAGISQEALGYRAGLHRTAIGQLERGERVARADTLIRLAGAMGIPAGDLLADLHWTPGNLAEGSFRHEPVVEGGNAVISGGER